MIATFCTAKIAKTCGFHNSFVIHFFYYLCTDFNN